MKPLCGYLIYFRTIYGSHFLIFLTRWGSVTVYWNYYTFFIFFRMKLTVFFIDHLKLFLLFTVFVIDIFTLYCWSIFVVPSVVNYLRVWVRVFIWSRVFLKNLLKPFFCLCFRTRTNLMLGGWIFLSLVILFTGITCITAFDVFLLFCGVGCIGLFFTFLTCSVIYGSFCLCRSCFIFLVRTIDSFVICTFCFLWYFLLFFVFVF